MRAADIDLAISRRVDTRGDAFRMIVEDTEHRKRADAGQHLKELLAREIAELAGLRTRAAHPGSLGGFALMTVAEQSLGSTKVTISLDGVPGGTLQLSAADVRAADPAGLVTRLENRLHRLETSKQEALDGIERARSEIAHARASIGQPFPQAEQLAEARDRARRIDEQLDQIVAESQRDNAEPDQRSALGIGQAIAVADGVARHTMAAGADWRDEVIRSGIGRMDA